MPNMPRTLAGYLEPKWIERANVARFWRTTPDAMKRLPGLEYARMREFAVRVGEAEKEALEAAKRGAPTPGTQQPPTRAQRSASGKPGPHDIVVGDRQAMRDMDGF